MVFLPTAIPRHETAPSTEEEWAEALKSYGNDRDDRQASKETPLTWIPEGDDESMSTSAPGPSSRSANSHGDSLDSNFVHAPPSFSSSCPLSGAYIASRSNGADSDGVPREHRSSFGSETSAAPGLGVHSTTPMIGFAFDRPRRSSSCGDSVDGEKTGAEGERSRLRTLYDQEGWLPGPIPSRSTRMRRKRALRLVGVCCHAEEGKERRKVLAKFSEMAQQIFQTSSASVQIMIGDNCMIQGTNPDELPTHVTATEATCSHSIIHPDDRCTVVADLSKDWRFRQSPFCKNNPYKVSINLPTQAHDQFYASAPLRYQSESTSIDIGTLCILDDVARDTFDSREQGLLQNLANMLVFQLTTLQAEIVAKRSAASYEQSIAYMRRSVMSAERPDSKASEKEIRKEKRAMEKQKARMREPLLDIYAGDSVPSGSPATLRPRRHSQAPDDVATKTGPKDSKDAKAVAKVSDRKLFTDAAKTLRGILRADAVAMVNLEDYQLFIKRSPGKDSRRKLRSETKENIITSFLNGQPWPQDIDPVVHYVPRSDDQGIDVLGTDSDGACDFHFRQKGAEDTLSEFIKTWLKTRHFWWDREDDDDLSQQIMGLMPNEAQTTLGTAFLTIDGKPKFAIFATWNRPPSEFGDSSTIALPFAWILGGCTMAALAVRKVREMEQSQISYSNLQAHELRTPLHQILAITQLLRSSMIDLADADQQNTTISSLTTTQQIRDLLPFLDAIDTSGKTLHGIVDNILSFLDLKAKDSSVSSVAPSLLNSPAGATQSIEVMFEELIHEASEEDRRSRSANGQPTSTIETVFEIIPPLLGEQVTEDSGGALRRALGKILSNAYKFIEGNEGCVEIYVDDVPDLLPPEGCEDLCLSKLISIKIIDNGKGMDPDFVREKLGEPWAKEDLYATGSGLSVHLAYRIIDLMGGYMEITSGPGKGTIVQLQVPVPRRQVTTPTSPAQSLERGETVSPSDPSILAQKPSDIEIGKKVAFVGFDSVHRQAYSLHKLGAALDHQFKKLGCHVVSHKEAELVIADGSIEESAEEGCEFVKSTSAKDIVYLVNHEHEANPDVVTLQRQGRKLVRRFRKPITPSILRESLFPGQSKVIQSTLTGAGGNSQSSISSPEQVDEHGHSQMELDGHGRPRLKAHFSDIPLRRAAGHARSASGSIGDGATPSSSIVPVTSPTPDNVSTCYIVQRLASLWKPRNMDIEEAVASLSLGDYFSSHRRNSTLARTPSNASSAPSTPSMTSNEYDIMSPMDSTGRRSGKRVSLPSETDTDDQRTDTLEQQPDRAEEHHDAPEPDVPVKVLVVEDNMVNRKILVRILSSKLPIEVCEAEDGHAAVEMFKTFTSPAIILLDINMPKMDGYQACTEMRAIEKRSGRTGKSQIIAVTALGGEAERHRGLVECGMNKWLTKPCGKATIHKAVEEARELLKKVEDIIDA